MNPPNPAASTRLAIVGGGPRAIGVLERLAAGAAQPELAAALQARPLRIDLIDPNLPGAGSIWRADENPLLLMNSRAADVTMFTDDSVDCAGQIVPGPSLAEWAEGVREGVIAAPTAGTERLREIEQLVPEGFAGRRVQALYLEWFFGQVMAALPSTVQVTVHRSVATAIRDLGEGGPWQVELADREPLTADLVLLSAGHTRARPDPVSHELAAFARRHGLAYVGPAQAAEADISALAAGQKVIVRGMGLGFIDLMALLTEGRGGRFEPDPIPGTPGRLRYLPSGQEPILWLGSRRGVPYHSKVDDEGRPTGPRDLVHVTEENLRFREDDEGRLDFREDVLPLIAEEIARAVPGAPRPEPGEELLAWLDDPLSWLHGDADPQVTRDAVVRHVENDLRSRTTGDTTDARALFQVLLRLTGALVDLLPAARLRGGTRSDYPRWWHSLFSFVDSGPPPHRLHQLLALERAGIVGFIGPRTQVWADVGPEGRGRFLARGGAGVRIEADALLDAFLPGRTLVDSANPLLRSLARGIEGQEPLGREAPSTPGRLEIDADQRVIAPDGHAHRTLWATGPWTSELPVGAFARPGTNAPCFRRNDALARDLLSAATARGATPPSSEAPSSEATRSETLRSGTLPAWAAPASRSPRLPRVGILGPGKIGTALARTALRSGLEVRIASRRPDPGVSVRIPGASTVSPEALGASCDIVILTVPLHAALAADPSALRGAVVVDVTNPWGRADDDALATARAALAGSVPAAHELSTSELLAAHLEGAHVVKTLNHIGYHDVEDSGRPAGDPRRRALAVAADDPSAAEAVSLVLGRMGYDAVRVGSLADGRHFEPGAGLFGGWATRSELEALRLEALRLEAVRAA